MVQPVQVPKTCLPSVATTGEGGSLRAPEGGEAISVWRAFPISQFRRLGRDEVGISNVSGRVVWNFEGEGKGGREFRGCGVVLGRGRQCVLGLTKTHRLSILCFVQRLVMIGWATAIMFLPVTGSGQNMVGPFFSPISSDSLTEGDYVLAFRDYQKASELNPADVDARIDLARLYIVMREYGKAITELEAARGLVGDEKALSELELFMGELYLKLGAYDKALEHLTGNGGNDFLMGYCHEKLDDWESALEYFNILHSTGDEFDEYSSYHRAKCLYQLERYEEALTGFRSFIDDFPLSIYVAFAKDMIPSCYEGLGKYNKAIHLRNDMMRRNPRLTAAMMYSIGRDYERLKDRVKAREQYMKVMTKHSRSRYALLSLNALKGISKIKGRTLYHAGRICYYQGDYQRAVRYLSSYTKTYPRGKYVKEGRYMLGKCYLRLRMHSAAELSFKKLARSVASEKERARYLFGLAKAQDRLGEDKKAKSTFEKVAKIRVSSLWDDAIYRRGLIQEESDSLEQAVKTYMQVSHGDYADNALYRAGMAAIALGRPDVANQALHKLVYLYPYSGFRSAARYWLARVLEQADSLELSLTHWGSVAKSSPFSYYGFLSRSKLRDNGAEGHVLLLTNSKVETWISSWAGECSPLSEYERLRLERGLKLLDAGLNDVGEGELGKIDTHNPLKTYVVARAYAGSGLDHKAIPLAKRILTMARDAGAGEVPDELVRIAYPLSFLPSALQALGTEDVDPLFILAMIREESTFLPEAVSPVGAMGLMQIMPTTGKVIARHSGRNNFQVDDLFEPGTSVSFGCHYILQQTKQFGSPELALAAYNAGPDVVRQWMKRRDTSPMDQFIESIPYPETRVYVKNVLASWWVYERIWGSTASLGP